MTDNLLPCPFCGGEPLIIQSKHANKLWALHCKNCDAGPSASLGRDEAVETWNRRAPSPETMVIGSITNYEITLGDLRRARDVLAATKEGQP
ncbi:Lar family restriction alleviation protein [Neorhizobium sp. NCHU2750]|uniref:Lar family restriction alleviation protein n=1 Tax=Neorhizobium sp. NCHU2750 TaxID=1825976 RepID=UPI000E750D94|nr:hypothetical protein NCHU2750_05930 [Neorhizobium sp. NCHU2750]